MSQTHTLLEQVNKVQTQLDEFFNLFSDKQASDDFLEEVHSIVDFLLNETRIYMSGDMNQRQYDKMNLFKSRIKALKELIATYKAKKANRSILKKINDKVVAPLTYIGPETPVVRIEKQLLIMLDIINNARGMKTNSGGVDLDDTMAEPNKSPDEIAQDAKWERDQIKDLTEAWQKLEVTLK